MHRGQLDQAMDRERLRQEEAEDDRPSQDDRFPRGVVRHFEPLQQHLAQILMQQLKGKADHHDDRKRPDRFSPRGGRDGNFSTRNTASVAATNMAERSGSMASEGSAAPRARWLASTPSSTRCRPGFPPV
jgi:hypothetical protein